VNQYFLTNKRGGWRVTGCIDMEVASAGDPLYDLVAFAIHMAAEFPPDTYWWQPLFRGYGDTPAFDLFRLRMLGMPEALYRAFDEDKWQGDWETILKRLWDARDWYDLFTT
jgi:aminoglycoside phosphotransferase